jgi:3-phosphoshikimate 1-carboxyvinyltransferase
MIHPSFGCQITIFFVRLTNKPTYLSAAMTITARTVRLPRHLEGSIPLDGSKSISNRALICLALAGATDPKSHLTRLSTSKDTTTLCGLLSPTHDGDTFDAGDAGTVFRFMAAYLCTRPGTQVLTGSHRMLERPIGALVTGLRALGADIQYLGNEGYPPLQIGYNPDLGRDQRTLSIEASVSSQFLSALMMIAPYLPNGIELVPSGRLVSRPYLDLTLRVMQYFGATCQWEGENIVVAPGGYTARPYQVEADWSAASYWYSMAALSDTAQLHLGGLFEDSGQGDAVVARMMEQFGVTSTYDAEGVLVEKKIGAKPTRQMFEQDFLECPDIAQTLAVTCAGLGMPGLFSGLETLSIKETDRIAAIKQELEKVGVSFVKLPARFSASAPDRTYYMLEGRAQWDSERPPHFNTYNDHRMAMSFAPLGIFGDVEIEDPAVVRKSYPQFWEHLERL